MTHTYRERERERPVLKSFSALVEESMVSGASQLCVCVCVCLMGGVWAKRLYNHVVISESVSNSIRDMSSFLVVTRERALNVLILFPSFPIAPLSVCLSSCSDAFLCYKNGQQSVAKTRHVVDGRSSHSVREILTTRLDCLEQQIQQTGGVMAHLSPGR